MRAWAILLGGLLVWTAHFFALYGIASILPGRPEARWLVIAATLPAVVAGSLILSLILRTRNQPDELDRWVVHVGAVGAVISLVAVIWQSLPAVMV